MRIRRGTFRVGTSGYEYDHWRGKLYPRDLPRRRWFDRYLRSFDTVEINNTFYRLPGPRTFDRWRRRAPAGFLYALKFSRYGTHMKKLKDPKASVPPFLERAARLGSRLGPILVQLPPRWGVDAGRLDRFLDAIPGEHRCTVEFRDPSWLCEEVFSVMQAHGAALCVHDLVPGHPRRVTAAWVYLRFHGRGRRRYAGTYPHQALAALAGDVRDWLTDGLDVYAYFNNDIAGYAVRDAIRLRRYVGKA